MSSENLDPSVIISSAGLSSVTTSQLMLNDASWATATSNNTNTNVRVGYPTPLDSLTPGANLQTIQAEVRRTSGSGSVNPTAKVELWETGGGSALASTSEITVTSDTTQTISLTFNASLLAVSSGANLEAVVVGSKSGGSPAKRSAVDFGGIRWITDETPAGAVHEVLLSLGSNYSQDGSNFTALNSALSLSNSCGYSSNKIAQLEALTNYQSSHQAISTTTLESNASLNIGQRQLATISGGRALETNLNLANQFGDGHSIHIDYDAILALGQEQGLSTKAISDLLAGLSLSNQSSINKSTSAVLNSVIAFGSSHSTTIQCAAHFLSALPLELQVALNTTASSPLGGIIEAALVLVNQLADTSSVNRTIESQAMFNHKQGDANLTTKIINSAIELGNRQAHTQSKNAELKASISLAQQHHLDFQQLMIWLAETSLSSRQAVVNQSAAEYFASIDFAVAGSLATTGGKALVADLALALVSNVNISAFVSLEGHTALNANLNDNRYSTAVLESTASFSSRFITAAINKAIIDAGLSLSSIRTVEQSGATFNISIETPEGQTVKIKFVNRTYQVELQNRAITVELDKRNAVPDLDDRVRNIPKEIRTVKA